jgi:hypothetical protein
MAHPSPLDPRLARALARLGRRGFSAADARRLVGPLAARLNLPRPSYSTVRNIVAAEKRQPHPTTRISPIDSLAQGRMPTPFELEAAFERHRNRS